VNEQGPQGGANAFRGFVIALLLSVPVWALVYLVWRLVG
jgi:hypothetical protein